MVVKMYPSVLTLLLISGALANQQVSEVNYSSHFLSY